MPFIHGLAESPARPAVPVLGQVERYDTDEHSSNENCKNPHTLPKWHCGLAMRLLGCLSVCGQRVGVAVYGFFFAAAFVLFGRPRTIVSASSGLPIAALRVRRGRQPAASPAFLVDASSRTLRRYLPITRGVSPMAFSLPVAVECSTCVFVLKLGMSLY